MSLIFDRPPLSLVSKADRRISLNLFGQIIEKSLRGGPESYFYELHVFNPGNFANNLILFDLLM